MRVSAAVAHHDPAVGHGRVDRFGVSQLEEQEVRVAVADALHEGERPQRRVDPCPLLEQQLDVLLHHLLVLERVLRELGGELADVVRRLHGVEVVNDFRVTDGHDLRN